MRVAPGTPERMQPPKVLRANTLVGDPRHGKSGGRCRARTPFSCACFALRMHACAWSVEHVAMHGKATWHHTTPAPHRIHAHARTQCIHAVTPPLPARLSLARSRTLLVWVALHAHRRGLEEGRRGSGECDAAGRPGCLAVVQWMRSCVRPCGPHLAHVAHTSQHGTARHRAPPTHT